jgi:hypothetical protein
VPIIDLCIAAEKSRTKEFDGAIELSRHVIAGQVETGATLCLGAVIGVLVESLLGRGNDADLIEAQAAIETLAAIPTDPDFVVYQLPLLKTRALLAKARDDVSGYRINADRYNACAKALGFEGHLATALAAQ